LEFAACEECAEAAIVEMVLKTTRRAS